MKALASLFLLAGLAATAKADITWTWSVTATGGNSGSGTFTTAGTTPTAGTTYTVTAITGTFNGLPITGLSAFAAPDQTFRWDGTSSSPLLVTIDGVSFATSANTINIWCFGCGVGYGGANTVIFGSGPREDVTSSSVAPLPPAFSGVQVRYASNLAIGDSVVNLTNDGASSSTDGLMSAGLGFQQDGQICANIYAYSPDEQLVSCCSCNVTPNGLNSLSAKNDLASNTLTPIIPSALVIKIVTTLGGTACTATSAATIPTTASPAGSGGLIAWGTTIHALPVTPGSPATTYGVTETAFSRGAASAAELTRMKSLCAFIRANGSGYGICKSCKIGGLGASAK